MTLKEAAQIYVDLVRLEESLAPDQHQARQEISALRSKYHDLFAEALRNAGMACADCFEATSRAFKLVSIEHFSTVARELAEQLSIMSRSAKKVLKAIHRQAKNWDLEGVQDHLALLRVGRLFEPIPDARIEFEELCSHHQPLIPHDVVVDAGGMRIVNEVKRKRAGTLDGSSIEQEHTSTLRDLAEGRTPSLLKEVRLRSDKTSVVSELTRDVREKIDQYCPNSRNILWFVTKNFLVNPEDVCDVAWRECGGHRFEEAYRQPEHLTGLGYLHDASETTDRPCCFLMQRDVELKNWLERADISVSVIGNVSLNT